MDIISVLEKIKNKYEKVFDEETLSDINNCLINPELKVDTVDGKLVAYCSPSSETLQAGVCFETEEGTMDLTCIEASLLTEKGKETLLKDDTYGFKPGDLKILIWSDAYDENYTNKYVIENKDIRKAMELEGEDVELD